MEEITAAALGQVIKKHRLDRRLTQEVLAIRAGYARKGAAVSISRIERGENRPSVDKLTGIASALGVTVEQLEAEARSIMDEGHDQRQAGVTDAKDLRTKIPRRELNERIASVLEQSQKRQEQVEEVAERVQAHQQTLVTEFLEPFIEVGSQVEDAPTAQWSQDSDDAHEQAGGSEEDAAGLRLHAVSSGLKSAIGGGLLGAGAGAAGGAALGFGAFSAAAAFGAASTGTAISALSGIAASNATWAFLGGGALAAGGSGIAGGVALITGVVAAPVLIAGVGAALWSRSRTAQKEAAAYQELLKAEQELADTKPSFDALMQFLSDLEPVLSDAATFGTRKFKKWRASLPEPPGRWDKLKEDQQDQFEELAEVIAAAAVASGIQPTKFMTLRGVELEVFADQAHVVLAKSNDIIQKWV